MSPSVTTSCRSLIFIGMTDVIGSTPVTSTSFNCSTKPRIWLSSPVIRSASSSLTAMRASRATRRTVWISTDMFTKPELGRSGGYSRARQAAQYQALGQARGDRELLLGRAALGADLVQRANRPAGGAFPVAQRHRR